MKYLFASFFALFISMVGNSQSMQSDHQWSFGIELFANSTYELVSNQDGSDPENVQFLQSTEAPKFCLSGLAYVSYKLSQKSFLSLGLGYQNTGYQTTKLPINYNETIDPRIGFEATNPNDPDLPTDIEITYNHHSLQIPLFFNYNFTSKFFVRGGISYLINLANNSDADLFFASGEKKKEDYLFDNSNYRSSNFSGNIGAGYTYYESSNINMYVQVNYERFLNPISTNGITNRTPVSTGLILGAKF